MFRRSTVKIAICLAAVAAFAAYGFRKSAHPGQSGVQPFVEAVQGDSVCRPDGDPWNRSGGGAFVIASLATCGACQQQIPFDEEVYRYATAHGIPVYYFLGAQARNDGRARELRDAGRTVLRGSLAVAGLERVPTIARINNSGVIESSWSGTIPQGRHDEILDSVLHGGSLQSYERIAEAELARYVSDHRISVIALSEIGKDPAVPSIIMSPQDLYVRARHEIEPGAPVLVDCGSALQPRMCQDAVIGLTAMAPRRVVVSGIPRRSVKCL